MNSSRGTVYLVGAGPGDPGLLTVRGAECLRRADVVMYDYLASAQLLRMARPGALLVCLGRHGHGRLMSQTEINELIVEHALAGRSVVRLKGGDPGIFARLLEEIDALTSASVPYEIIPGVTAAQGASSCAGIPLTNREEASCVAFVTGQESKSKDASDALDYAALAKFPGTLVFYMGITTADDWSRALISHGKAEDTPVAIVRRATLPEQQTTHTTLQCVADLIQTEKIRPPAILIVGEAARERDTECWFTTRPLFGKTVLLTRPEHQSQELTDRLGELGASVLCQAAIEISEPKDWRPVDEVITHLSDFAWVVFSSSNGVEYFMRRLFERGLDARSLNGVKLAAIGPATAGALARFHLTADLFPNEYRAEALAQELAPHVNGKRVFLARASRGREVLAQKLEAGGANVTQAVVYESRDVEVADDDIRTALEAGRVDWTTVSSSAISRSLVRLFGASLRRTKLVAISPLTADVLAEAGYPPAAVAETYTGQGVVEAILNAEGGWERPEDAD